MKILIICNDFPPLNSIGAQRPYGWFRYFHEEGVDVTVITKQWTEHSNNLKDVLNTDSGVNDLLVEKYDFGTIIRTRNRITLAESFIVKYGEKRFVLIRKMLTFIYKILGLIISFFDKHYNLYVTAKNYISKNNIDIVITTGEPFILFIYGNKLKKKFGVKWIADYRDGWYTNQNIRKNKNIFTGLMKKWEWLFEKHIIKNADIVTAAYPYLVSELSALHNRLVELIYNGFDEFYSYDNKSGTSSEKLTLTHSGTLIQEQRAEFLLQAVKELDEKGLINEKDFEINFIGIEFSYHQLERILSFNPNIRKYIKTTGRLPRSEAIFKCSQSDYLIVFTAENEKTLYAKTFDYISVKRPILVLPSDHSIICNIVTTLHAGTCIDDKEALKQFLVEAIKRKKTKPTVAFADIDIEKALFYTRRTQAKLFIDLVRNYFYSEKPTILILCHDYPPLNSVGAQRPASWFRFFKKNGVNVVLITKSWRKGIASASDALKGSLEKKTIIEESDNGIIIRVPYKPTLSERMYIKYGVAKFIFLRKALTFISKFLSYHFSFFERTPAIYKEANHLLKYYPIDVIIATGEPFILFKYGYLLKKKFKTPWIADYRDGWYLNNDTTNRKDIQTEIMRKWEFFFEKKYISNVDLIISVNTLLAKELSDMHSKPSEVIYNGFEDIKGKEIKIEANKLILTHGGTISPRDNLEFLLQAISELNKEGTISPESFAVKFIGIEFYTDQLQRILNYDTDIRKFIITTPRLPREELFGISMASDFLITLTDKRFPMINTKVYEYIAAKRPILVIPEDKVLQTPFVVDRKLGFSFSSVEQLKSFLIEQINAKQRGKRFELKDVDQEKIKYYSRENQAKILADIIKRYKK